MKFIDEAKIEVQAGDGGNGSASFRREKYVAERRAGRRRRRPRRQHLRDRRPQHQHADRLSLRAHPPRRATARTATAPTCYGKGGEDMVLRVPVGTVITDTDTGELIADLAERRRRRPLIAKGGKGGLGNMHFKSSTNRAPRQCTHGEAGRGARTQAGTQGAGRRRPARACPTPASPPSSAPFPPPGRRSPTTRSPRCTRTSAWCASTSDRSFVDRRHSRPDRGRRRRRRTRPPVPAPSGAHPPAAAPGRHRAARSEADPVREAHAIVQRARRSTTKRSYQKPRWLVLNKMDMLPGGRARPRASAVPQATSAGRGRCFIISAITGEGCKELIYAIMEHLDQRTRAEDRDEAPAARAGAVHARIGEPCPTQDA